MACHWRIRHKLILGLCLVVGILALVVAGTYRGLASFRATTSSFDSKLIELAAAQELRASLQSPVSAPPGSPGEPRAVQQKYQVAREKLAAYEAALQETIARGHEVDKNGHVRGIVEQMHGYFAELDRGLEAWRSEGHGGSGPSEALELSDNRISKPITALLGGADALHTAVYRDLYGRITTAKTDYRSSMIYVLSTTIGGVLLMTGLLRFFYRWTFYPIRDLQAGVDRVARGDFEHSIDVQSRDEMQELAAAFNDMTGRLREMYRDLARQVNERSRQLVRSERLASVGFLAAGVAHEINNPLASILFCSEALEARLTELLGPPPRATVSAPSLRLEPATEEDRDREVVSKYLKMIQQESLRCKKITQRLLEFSRGGEKRREPTNLVELVQAVLDVVQHLPNSSGKQVLFTDSNGRPPKEVVAAVNGEEIKSVVLNLVVNALDSMDEGGALRVMLNQRDGMAEMVFTDTGCGMTAEVLENIFEPFFTRSRTGKGTGLGLSISHRIITQHGGEVEATSPGPDKGSTFTVRIPLQPAESTTEESTVRLAA